MFLVSAMVPVFGEWSGVELPSYGVLYSCSAFLFLGLLAILLLARRQNQAPAIDLTILMVVSYSLGARVLYAIVGGEWTFFTEFSLEKLQSGLWGGQVVFALFAGVYLAVSRASVRHLSDALAVTWAGGTVVHKTGCFLAGCCYGAPTAVPWAVTFPEEGLCAFPGEPLHPTQLYDAGAALLVAIGLGVAYFRKATPGRLLLWWGLLYALTKFASEWFRGDERFPVVGPLTAAMLVELFTAAACAVLLARPGFWQRVLDAIDRPTTSLPDRTAGRARPALAVLVDLALATGMSAGVGVASGALAYAALAFFAYYVLINLIPGGHPVHRVLGLRLVRADGTRPGRRRLLFRGLTEAISPLTFFGLLRPLLDERGRTVGDGCASTYPVWCNPHTTCRT